jgi:hypothetical protein
MGTASGWSTRDGAHRLVATATVAALQEYLSEGLELRGMGLALGLEGVEFVTIGHQQIALVALELLAHREHKPLSGCCTVGQDRHQAVVLATLSALNRLVGWFPTRETDDNR